ncbi:unnamed protein product [Sympodiomycopsis kandeliae]
MVHADSALIPSSVTSQDEFYSHLSDSLASLLSGQRSWVTNLSNASSILYASLNTFRRRNDDKRIINWAGFYLISGLFPNPKPEVLSLKKQQVPTIILGPFHGLPACQAIPSIVGKGVCADGSAVLPPTTVRVPDTDAYPGHIACDSESKSEIVIPLVVPFGRLSKEHQDSIRSGDSPHWAGRVQDTNSLQDSTPIIVGLLDIDCVELEGFDERDQAELEKIVKIISDSCDW